MDYRHKFSKKICCSGRSLPNAVCKQDAKPSPIVSSLLGIYKEKCKDDLGAVNVEWFSSAPWNYDAVSHIDSTKIKNDVSVSHFSRKQREDTQCTLSSENRSKDIIKHSEHMSCLVVPPGKCLPCLVNGKTGPQNSIEEKNISSELVRVTDVQGDEVHMDREGTDVVNDSLVDVERMCDGEDKKEEFEFKTPRRKPCVDKSKQLYSTPVFPSPSSNVSTPSLFSQDEQIISKYKHWNISPYKRLNTLSPATPGSHYQASTSNLVTPSSYTPCHSTLILKQLSPFAPSQSFCHNESFSTCGDTPKFMEELLMDEKSETKMSSRLEESLASSNKLIPVSLGIDHDANISWTSSLATPPMTSSLATPPITSSLATPPIKSSTTSTKTSAWHPRESTEKQSGIIARALFNNSNVDTWEVDSHNATDMLDLAKTSSDEEEREMTVETEMLDATLQQQAEGATVNLLLNRTRLEGSLNKDICDQTKCDLVLQSAKYEQKTAISKPLVPEACDKLKNNELKDINIVDSKNRFQTMNKVDDRIDSEAKVQKPSPIKTSLSQVIVNEILTKYSPEDGSNIADTLAFLLDTPPERRQKFSKKKPPPKKSSSKRRSKRKRKTSKKNEDDSVTDILDSNSEDKYIIQDDFKTISPKLSRNPSVENHKQKNTHLVPESLPDNNKDKLILELTATTKVKPLFHNKLNGAIVTTPSSQVDPFSQISPSFIDTLCKVTDDASVTSDVAKGEKNGFLVNKYAFKNEDKCCSQDNMCNMLTNGAVFDRNNKQIDHSCQQPFLYLKTDSKTEACNMTNIDAGYENNSNGYSVSISKKNSSRFIYSSDSLPVSPRINNLFNHVLTNKSSFTYSTKGAKQPSPKKFKWMESATIVKEDSDNEDDNTIKEVPTKENEKSTTTFQINLRRPVKKDFLTFSTFFDEDENSKKSVVEHERTTVSRKPIHLPRTHGMYELKVEDMPTDYINKNIPNRKNNTKVESFSRKSLDVMLTPCLVKTAKQNDEQCPSTSKQCMAASSRDAVTQVHLDNFDDEFVTATQAQKEIAAADEAEMVYAFMQEEEVDCLIEEVSLSGVDNNLNGPSKVNFPSDSNISEITNARPCMREFQRGNNDVMLDLPDEEATVAMQTLNLNKKENLASDFHSLETREENFSKTKLKVDVEDHKDQLVPSSACTDIDEAATSFVGFITGAGKKVNISEDALCKVKEKFDDVDELSNEFFKTENSSKVIPLQPKKTSFGGFMTGAGKKVNISEDAFCKVKERFDDVNELSNEFKTENSSKVNPLQPKKTTSFGGFITGAGKKVNISEDSLRKVKDIFDDNFTDDRLEESIVVSNNTAHASNQREMPSGRPDREKPFVGFMTGQRNKVKVSEESLKKVRQKFDNDEFYTVNITANPIETSSCDEDKDKSFVGFKTGRGYTVRVSEESLKKVKQTFENDDFLNVKNNPLHTANPFETSSCCNKDKDEPFVDFTTGRGKKVKISEESLKKVKQTFDDEDFATLLNVNNDASHSRSLTVTSKPDIDKPFVGFKTGRGKKVKISEESLKKVKQTSDDGEDLTDFTSSSFNNNASHSILSSFNKPDIRKPFAGFMTGRGKQVKISEESLKKVKQTFDDENMNAVNINNNASYSVSSSFNKPDIDKPFAGFMTGRGKKVKILEESLKKVKQTFDNEDCSSDALMNELTKTSDTMEKDSQVTPFIKTVPHSSHSNKQFIGFMTGRGNKVNISEESLKKVKQTFDEEEIDTANINNNCSHSRNLKVTSSSKSQKDKPFAGFMTGRGNKVKISEESLMKVKQTFNDEEINAVKINNNSSNSILSSNKPQMDKPFAGFMTGGGKKVKISEESLKKVKQTFDEDIDTAKVNNNCSHSRNLGVMVFSKSHKDKPFAGFMTGRGNKVKISEESLKKVKQSFDDFEDTTDFTSASSSNWENKSLSTSLHKPLEVFRTGKRNAVSISEASLKKVQQKCDNVILFDNNIVPNVTVTTSEVGTSSGFTGFKTAGGTSVPVSADSLSKVKMVLENQNVSMDLKDTNFIPAFITGRGNQVDISDDAIRHGKQLLCNVEDKIPNKSQVVPAATRSIPGFHTARGSKVDISDAAIKHVQDVLQDQTSMKNSEMSSLEDVLLREELEKMSKSKENLLLRRNQSNRNTTTPTGSFRQNASYTHSLDKSVSVQDSCSKDIRQEGSRSFKTSPEHILSDRILPGSITHQFKSHPKSSFKRGSNLGSETVNKFTTPFKEGASSKFKSGPQPSRLFDKPASSRRTVVGPFAKKLKLDLSSENGVVDELCVKDGNCVQSSIREQSNRIQGKKNYTVKPSRGILRHKRKTSERIKLGKAVHGALPGQHSKEQMFYYGVLPSTVAISADSAEEFQLDGSDHFSEGVLSSGGIKLADGGTLVFDDAGKAGKKEFYNALLDTPGVEPRLVAPEWLSNHYRWIVWKLASLERSYPSHFGGRLLTPESVLLRLKYRYDREIDETQRSAIKMITERDDTPSKTMVLCVASVFDHSTDHTTSPSTSPNKAKATQTSILLTDGWYSIPANIDPALQRFVKTGKLTVGQKIIIHSAELTGSQEACPPLEAPPTLKLKISANSTRRARYDTKLGFQRNPQPFTVLLSSLYGEGGMVGCLDVVVARAYPIMYMERLAEGGFVFRSEKAERKAAADYSRNHQKKMEDIYYKISSKFEDASSENKGVKRKGICKLSIKEISTIQTGREIHEAMETAFDPNSIKMHLSSEQLESLEAYNRRMMDKRQADMQAEMQKVIGQSNEKSSKRLVTPLLKVRLVDYNLCERSLATNVMFTVWRPSEEVVNLLKEGHRLKVFNVSASVGWSKDGSNPVQLASTRSTRYNILPTSPGVLDIVYSPRVVNDFCDVGNVCFQPDYQEMNVVGLVLFVTPYSGNSSRPQTVYLSDKDVNILALKFWGGMKVYHVDEIVKPGNFICVSNLQWKGMDKRSRIACGHVNDMTVITQNPRTQNLKKLLKCLQDQIMDPKSFIEINQDVIEGLLSIVHQPQTPVTPYAQPPLPPPLSTPRVHRSKRISSCLQFTPSPSFAVPRSSALQDRTPVLPKNKFATPKSQDFRAYYSKRLYTKDGKDTNTSTSLIDQKNVDIQEGIKQTPKTSCWKEIDHKASKTPLLSTPGNSSGITFPLSTKKIITPKSQNFSSYYKNNSSTGKSQMTSLPHLTSTPMSAKKESQLRRNSLRLEQLSRIPSPPPLQQLYSDSSALSQSYKKPIDHAHQNTIRQEGIDDLELQALDAGFSNRTLALDDSGDFDFSEASPEKKISSQSKTFDDIEMDSSLNTSCLSQISDIPTQVLRDLDLSGLEEITSSAPSIVKNDDQDKADMTSTLTQLSEMVKRENDPPAVMEDDGISELVINTNVSTSQEDFGRRKRKRATDGRGELSDVDGKSSQTLDDTSSSRATVSQSSSRRVTRSSSKKVFKM
ncbi:uncharacterized protein [Antedon mediterranea]|uniref:uncharacterized protein n=1 Tax=Antedon mediterranea TaxID=105859 RepID=UPI003AF9E132